jgi:hypothetical protein
MSVPAPQASNQCTHHPEVAATGICGRCGRGFCPDCLVPLRGQSVCAPCKHIALSADFRSHQVYVPTQPIGYIPEAAAPGPAPPALPIQSACSLHTAQPAIALCERCGDFICLLCLTPFEGKSYCVRCFELLWGRGELDSRQRRRKFFEDPGSAMLGAVLTWMTLFLPFVSVLPALGAVTIAGVAIGKHGKQLARGEWVLSVLAILIALAGLVASLLLWMRVFT